MRAAFTAAAAAAGPFILKFLGFLAILIVGYFVAKIIANVVAKVLERVGFDRAVERGGIRKALARSQYDPSDILAKVVFYGLFLFVLTLAFQAFGENPVSELLASVIRFLPKIFVAVVIVVVAAALATAARELVVATLGGLSYGTLLGNLAAGAILMIGIVAALNQVEIAPEVVNGLYYTVLAIIAGSAIIAIGGGGIQPMRQRWESTLSKYDEEKDNVRREIQATDAQDLRAHAQQRREELRSTDSTAPVPTSPTIQLPEDEISRRT